MGALLTAAELEGMLESLDGKPVTIGGAQGFGILRRRNIDDRAQRMSTAAKIYDLKVVRETFPCLAVGAMVAVDGALFKLRGFDDEGENDADLFEHLVIEATG